MCRMGLRPPPQIVLPPRLERIREKLAENIHELWALTRIEQGWTYGPVSAPTPHTPHTPPHKPILTPLRPTPTPIADPG